jgi:hypothetical protein
MIALVTGGKYIVFGWKCLYAFALTTGGSAALLTATVPLLVVIAIGVWRK